MHEHEHKHEPNSIDTTDRIVSIDDWGVRFETLKAFKESWSSEQMRIALVAY